MKKYLRYCDACGKEVASLWDFGVTTLYRRVRIGRGIMIHDYEDGSILNQMTEKQPDDYDNGGTGWKRDEDKEFTFCGPECLLLFLTKAYQDTYLDSINKIKAHKKEHFDVNVELFEKKNGGKIPFFQKIQTAFSKGVFRHEAIRQADQLIKELQERKARLQR